MQEFIVKSARKLDICLRTLYANSEKFRIDVCEDDKGKVYYSIKTDMNEQKFKDIKMQYESMI